MFENVFIRNFNSLVREISMFFIDKIRKTKEKRPIEFIDRPF